MLGGIPQQQQQQPQQQNNNTWLDQSINNARNIMQQFQNSQNPQQMMMNILYNNPQFAQIASIAARNGNLEQVARQLAQQKGVDINDIISRLTQK